jgi:protein phosphatase
MATVEDHPYRTAACPVSAELVETLAEMTRKAQALAVEQAWSLDWTRFARHRREESEARTAGDPRKTLKAVGEMIAMLGVAARFHRKSGGGPADVACREHRGGV